MLKIGEFAQLSQVTVKTLHHYDELGLIMPVKIDPANNYRYYSVEQLPRIHRIMALKEIGLSLDQIKLMLDDDLPAEQIRGMLRLKQNEAEQQMRAAQQKLALIAFRLNMIEAETAFPKLDVVMKRLEPMRFLSYIVPLHPTLAAGLAHREMTAKVVRQAIDGGVIEHTGTAMDVYHGETILPFESPHLQENQHEILLSVTEAQEPVTLPGVGSWTIKEMPEVATAATLMISAHEENGLEAVEKVTLLRRWAMQHHFKPRGLVRFLHHRGPLQTLNSSEFLIEAQLPVVGQ